MDEKLDPTNQDKKIPKLSERSESIRNRRKNIFQVATTKGRLRELLSDVRKYGDSLREKYPNYQEWQVFHDMTGSSDPGAILDDFPADDSVETFLSEMEAKYQI